MDINLLVYNIMKIKLLHLKEVIFYLYLISTQLNHLKIIEQVLDLIENINYSQIQIKIDLEDIQDYNKVTIKISQLSRNNGMIDQIIYKYISPIDVLQYLEQQNNEYLDINSKQIYLSK